MVEAKLRVEISLNVEDNNPFYGNRIIKRATEETSYRDKDVRKHIAPSGIKATLMISDNSVMDITINRYYLEHEATDNGLSGYVAYFVINDKAYDVCVWFNEDNTIKDISLSEWLDANDFGMGYGFSNIYKANKDFASFASLLS